MRDAAMWIIVTLVIILLAFGQIHNYQAIKDLEERVVSLEAGGKDTISLYVERVYDKENARYGYRMVDTEIK